MSKLLTMQSPPSNDTFHELTARLTCGLVVRVAIDYLLPFIRLIPLATNGGTIEANDLDKSTVLIECLKSLDDHIGSAYTVAFCKSRVKTAHIQLQILDYRTLAWTRAVWPFVPMIQASFVRSPFTVEDGDDLYSFSSAGGVAGCKTLNAEPPGTAVTVLSVPRTAKAAPRCCTPHSRHAIDNCKTELIA